MWNLKKKGTNKTNERVDTENKLMVASWEEVGGEG